MEIYGVKTVIITGSSTNYSAALSTGGYAVQAIQAPVGIVCTALNVQGSVDNGTTFQNLIANGSAYTITVSGGKTSLLNPSDLLGFSHLKFSPNADESTNQRIFKVVILDL